MSAKTKTKTKTAPRHHYQPPTQYQMHYPFTQTETIPTSPRFRYACVCTWRTYHHYNPGCEVDSIWSRAIESFPGSRASRNWRNERSNWIDLRHRWNAMARLIACHEELWDDWFARPHDRILHVSQDHQVNGSHTTRNHVWTTCIVTPTKIKATVLAWCIHPGATYWI